MTREEAIKICKNIDASAEIRFKHPEVEEAFNMAIEALEQESSHDAISRQAVLDIDFHKLIHTTAKPAEMIRQKIEQLPPVKPQEKTGYWRPIYQGDEIIGYRCSECEFGKTRNTHRANYCHNCGIKMVQESEE